jgi:hypothetical protein
MLRLLVTANVVPSSPILVTLMVEVVCSSETLALTRPTQHHIPEVNILHSHQNENLKSYMVGINLSALTGKKKYPSTPARG